MIMKNKLFIYLFTAVFFSSCSLSPGMHMSVNKSNGQTSIYIEELDEEIQINDIALFQNKSFYQQGVYTIGKGDQVSLTVWGLPEIFPNTNINPDQNLRRVDSKGNIFFPYIGLVKAEGKTQDQLRTDISIEFSKYFTDPQIDVSIARFNSQKIYLLGEVVSPSKINITDVPLSLSEALGEVKGLNNNTSSGSEVFIVRQGKSLDKKEIYYADLSSPSGFLVAGNFYLEDNDIIYVNAKSTTRWNRVISQFFPFSTFLNSIDNLVQD